MNPTTALEELIDAALNGEPEGVREYADNLATWLERGGFKPSLADIQEHVANLHTNRREP